MASYQDIETRLRVVEDKIDFVMKTFSVTKVIKSHLVGVPDLQEVKSLLDIYREVRHAGLTVVNPSEEKKEEENGSVSAS